MQLLLTIVAANVASRLLALSLASVLSFHWLSRYAGAVTCFAGGLLLAVSAGHLIPEALHSGIDAATAAIVVIASFASFVFLDRLLVVLCGHEHEGSVRSVTKPGRTWSILVGAGCHNFVDGVLIATAFIVDMHVGILVTLAVFAHELPQLVGHLVLLTRFGLTRVQAVLACIGLAMMAVFGGVVGVVVFEGVHALIPYAMLVSAGSFLFAVFSIVRYRFAHCVDKRGTLIKTVLFGLIGAAAAVFVLMPLHESAHETLHDPDGTHIHVDDHGDGAHDRDRH